MSRRQLTPQVTHGRASTYKVYGCRCEPCTEANAKYQRESNARRAAKFATGEVDPPHGKHSTYTNYGCRCDACTEANSEVCRLHKAHQKVAS